MLYQIFSQGLPVEKAILTPRKNSVKRKKNQPMKYQKKNPSTKVLRDENLDFIRQIIKDKTKDDNPMYHGFSTKMLFTFCSQICYMIYLFQQIWNPVWQNRSRVPEIVLGGLQGIKR